MIPKIPLFTSNLNNNFTDANLSLKLHSIERIAFLNNFRSNVYATFII